MAAIAQINQLVKVYTDSDVRAVDQISFEIREGEVLSLLGPNGAGKSTTISMLSGLLKPTAGDATIAGKSIIKDPILLIAIPMK